MDILNNGTIKAAISAKGAELNSLMLDGIERIWQADPSIWNRHAPLLFPVIGRLCGQEYELDGEMISMPRHGFCRDRVFDVVEKDDLHVRYRTTDDEETRAVYPFSFTLEVEFALEGSTLVKRHFVTNRSDREMPFEVGGHEAYNTTLLPGETMADYSIQFEGMDHLEPYAMDESGMLDLPKGNLPLEKGCFHKRPMEVGLDTIVVDHLPVNKASLVSSKSGTHVTVEFDDFPYLGIWTMDKDVDTNYLCIEPWSSLPDARFVGRKLTDKAGICIAQPSETKELSYRMTFQ